MSNGISLYKKQTSPSQTLIEYHNTSQANKNNINNETLKGVLLNNYIKKEEKINSIDTFSSNLLTYPKNLQENENTSKEYLKENNFDYKKAIKPIALSFGLTLGGVLLLSSCFKNYSKYLSQKNNIVRPGDLPRSMNLLEETDLAIFRALRDPNKKNIFGLIGVGMFSILTLGAKNFIEGTKEIWVKKQNCDITQDLQTNLIDVEAQVFKGKLNVVNSLLTDTTKYFSDVLSDDKRNITYKNYISFKGKENKNQKENNKNNSLKTIGLIAGSLIGIIGLSYLAFKNYSKSMKNLELFEKKITDSEIRKNIEKAIQNNDKNKAIEELSNILKLINAKDETIKENLSKIKNITQIEIVNATKDIKNAQIYAQAPEALAGVGEKIQYYCFVNEPRGHLYNWILNPDNPFNKFLFLSLATSSGLAFTLKQATQAVKEVTVSRENSNSELGLRKKLVNVEIENFKAKKMSAIIPLLENFELQRQQGKTKQELNELAQNILLEIKNGPPYVYA